MKVVIIYASIHHKNTEKIAREINEELNGELIPFSETSEKDVVKADLVGFGSGIYMRKFHNGLIRFIKDLPEMNEKKCFLFSTAGSKSIIFNRGHKLIKRILKNKNFKVVGEFDCLGYDSFGPLKFFGGVNKGRPNKSDLNDAREFAKKLSIQNKKSKD